MKKNQMRTTAENTALSCSRSTLKARNGRSYPTWYVYKYLLLIDTFLHTFCFNSSWKNAAT